MSETVSFSDKFSNRFHIGKVKRKPLRQEVSALRARAMRLPQTEEMRGLMAQLNSARDTIYGKAKTNAQRQTSVDTTRRILEQVRPRIETLEQDAPEITGYKLSGRKATKEDEARAKEILKELATLQGQVETLLAPSKDHPNVMMPPGLGRLDLNGQVELVRLHVGEAIVTEKRAAVLRTEIEAVEKALEDAGTFISDFREYVETCRERLEAVRKLLADEVQRTPELAGTPIHEKLAAVERALTPEMNLVNPDGIERLVNEFNEEADLLEEDPEEYAEGATAQREQETDSARELENFDNLVKGPLADLRLRAEALGTQDYVEELKRSGQVRSGIARPNGPVPDGVQMAQPVLVRIATATQRLIDAAAQLRQQVADLHDEVVDAIDDVQDTRDMAVFAEDWRAIDGLHAAVEELIPADDAPLDAETMTRLGSAAPLVQTLKARALAIATARDTVGDFDGDLAALKTAMEEADGKGKPLAKYFPKELKTLQDTFAKIEKGVGSGKATAAAAALAKLKADFDDKLEKATELADYIDDVATPLHDRCMEIFRPVMVLAVERPELLPSPNTPELAMIALETELEKTPPDKAALTRLVEALEKAFETIDDPDALIDAAARTHEAEVAKQENEKKITANLQRPLKDRLYRMKMQFEEAEAAVKLAKGDETLTKQIDRMIEQAQSEIEAVTATKPDGVKKPEATLDRIQRHLDLVLAHPEGEVNRRRKELPGLYDEYRKTRVEVSEQLKALVEMIGEYQAPPKDKRKVSKLVKQIEQYRSAFAKGHNNFAPFIGALTDDERPEGERRKARESALAAIGDLERGLLSHPLTALIATVPVPGVRGAPRRLLNALDRLNFTILTAVE